MEPVLIVTAVDAEARAIGAVAGAEVIVGGIGRTNAAVAVTRAIGRRPFRAIMSAGVAGALPGSELEIGDVVVASSCVYVEEGLITPDGFVTLDSIGLTLGDFEGNAVPVDADLLDALGMDFRLAAIATVATCSGTDAQAQLVARRTGAIAEAMEGAAVVHAARTLGVPAIELRSISNTTGERSKQVWDLGRGLEALKGAVRRAIARLDDA